MKMGEKNNWGKNMRNRIVLFDRNTEGCGCHQPLFTYYNQNQRHRFGHPHHSPLTIYSSSSKSASFNAVTVTF